MLCDSRFRKQFVVGGLILACAALIACQRDEHSCQRGEQYFSESAQQLLYAEQNGTPVLLARTYGSLQWHPISPDGSIGAPLASAPRGVDPAWVGNYFHLAVPLARGFRLIGTHGSAYVEPGSDGFQDDRYRSYTARSSGMPSSISIERAFSIGGSLYVIWAGIDSAGPSETWLAGLGQLSDDDAVTQQGEPFYRGPRPQGIAGLRFFGGWDPDGFFWIDLPMPDFSLHLPWERSVVQIALDGTWLGTQAVAGDDIAYRLHWLKLPSGRWAGLQGSTWQLFSVTERLSGNDVQDVVPFTGTTTGQTQWLDKDGALRIAGPGRAEVVVHRFDDATSMFANPVSSPLDVGYCDTLLGLL